MGEFNRRDRSAAPPRLGFLKMKAARLLLICAALLFAAWIIYWALFSPKEDISTRISRTIDEQSKHADLYYKKVTFEEVSGTAKYWQLSAVTAMVNKSTGLATLKDATGIFFKRGRPTLKFRSPSALWDMTKKEIYLDQPVGYDINLESKITKLLAKKPLGSTSFFNLPTFDSHQLGYWFQAHNLSWKVADQRLVCSGGILLKKGNVSGFAEKLSGDVALEKVFLTGQPRLELQLKKSFPVTVEAAEFEIVSSQDRFFAHGQPRITWGPAVVLAEGASYLQRQKKLDLTGGVQINYKDISAFGQEGSFLTEAQLITLSGEASAQQGANKLSGNKVQVSLKDQKISLLGKGKVVITEEEKK